MGEIVAVGKMAINMPIYNVMGNMLYCRLKEYVLLQVLVYFVHRQLFST